MSKKIIYAAAAVVAALIVVIICVRVLTTPAKAVFSIRVQSEQVGEASRLALHFINDGPGEMTLATGDLQTALVRSNDNQNLFCLYMGRADDDQVEGRRVVVSPYDLRPVTLRAKEEVRLNDITPLLAGLPAGKITLVVAYEIPKAIGDRYDVWSGYIESNMFELTTNQQPAPETGAGTPAPLPQP